MTIEQSIAEQYQIGDRVVYIPEGIVTKISGYMWRTSTDRPPEIVAYELECGIAISSDYFCRAAPASGGHVNFFFDQPNTSSLPEQTPAAIRASMRAANGR